jgi:hypothetical protein
MSAALAFEPGNFRYSPGSPQFSRGVAAAAEFRIVRVRFARPLPLTKGFNAIADLLSQADRALTALCACELRLPKPLDEAEFAVFNRAYIATLEDWGLADAGFCPVARSNVCPLIEPPSEPSFFAFAYTERAPGAPPSYVLSGCAEARPGTGPYADRVVRYGDVSADGLHAKARFVLETIEARAAALGVILDDLTGAQVYCGHDLRGVMRPEYLPRAALRNGVTWQLCRPPVLALEYELDCRAVSIERVLTV